MMNEHILHLLNKEGKMKLGPLMHEKGIPVPCYPDIRSIYSRPPQLRILVSALAVMIERDHIDAFAGCPYGGMPLAIALAMTLNRPFITVRPHDEQSSNRPQLEGAWRKGQRIALVDDSLILGRQKKRAVELLEEAKLRPTHLLVVMELGGFPAQSKERQWITDRGIKVRSLVTWHEWVHYMQREGTVAKEVGDSLLRLLDNPPEWVKD